MSSKLLEKRQNQIYIYMYNRPKIFLKLKKISIKHKNRKYKTR